MNHAKLAKYHCSKMQYHQDQIVEITSRLIDEYSTKTGYTPNDQIHFTNEEITDHRNASNKHKEAMQSHYDADNAMRNNLSCFSSVADYAKTMSIEANGHTLLILAREMAKAME